MADEVDITTERAEVSLRSDMLSSRKPVGPQPNGRCHWCDEIVADHERFCDNYCRDDWEREQAMLVRRGRFADG